MLLCLAQNVVVRPNFHHAYGIEHFTELSASLEFSFAATAIAKLLVLRPGSLPIEEDGSELSRSLGPLATSFS